MELKHVGKVGMVKRKQFLQKRDFSRSHEVKQKLTIVFTIACKKKVCVKKQNEQNR